MNGVASSVSSRAPAAASAADRPCILYLGETDYDTTWRAMRAHVMADAGARREQIWITSHPPVFTQGRAGRPEHVLAPGDIPVVASDRGGQVTYHGPGQAVVYTLIDLKARGIGIRRFVTLLEAAVIDVLAAEGLVGARREGAPGVYVAGAKIAALGLRLKDGMTYHGVALNVAMDLEPFRRIHPCGFAGLEVTQLSDFGIEATPETAGRAVADSVCARLGERSLGRN